MGFLSSILGGGFGGTGGGGVGIGNKATATSTENNNYDQRRVVGNGSVVSESGSFLSTDNHQALNSNNSTALSYDDHSSTSTALSYDDHSSTSTTTNITDGGAFALVDGVVKNSLWGVQSVASDALGRMSAVTLANQNSSADTIKGAFGLIDATIKDVNGHADSMLTQSISTLAGQMQSAYADAKGGGSNQDKIAMLAIAGLVVMGAVIFLRK
jgi:hypothetical protein